MKDMRVEREGREEREEDPRTDGLCGPLTAGCGQIKSKCDKFSPSVTFLGRRHNGARPVIILQVCK